jgi:hypothetical protein
MKIEMAESLFLSWLRHVKQCQIVQLNWKPSTSWKISNEQQVESITNKYREYFRHKYDRELFGEKGNQSYNQVLKQGEIDVLGIELSGNKIASIYAVDVAFHEDGLHYGKTPKDAITRVIKKMIRSTMIIMAYFGMNKGRIVFASPKVNPSTYEPLREAVEGVNTLMSELKLKFSFRLYANSDFEKDIIAPVIQLSGEVADTSELFMRSVQLYQIFTDRIKDAQQEGKERNRGTDEIKIGQLVRTTFKELFSKRKIGKKMAAKLMDVTYSKKTFGLSFPILKEINDSILLSKQITDGKGRSRYWSQEFANGKYLICSQWYAKHRKKFLDWSNKLLQE